LFEDDNAYGKLRQRRQNKFGKVWEQTKVTARTPLAGRSFIVVSYFNWIWQHSRLKTTAAQPAQLTDHPWAWQDIANYPTIL